VTVDPQNICDISVLVHITVLEESVHDAQCTLTAQLEQESSVNVSITMLVDHTTPYHDVVPNVCIEVTKRIVDSIALTLRRASLISSTNSGYSAFEF